MKNILIPTTFEADTLQAMKIAAYMTENKGRIVLISSSEISDSITELLFLSAKDHINTSKRDALRCAWKEYRIENNISMVAEEHHQFGMSRPVMQKLLEGFEADIVIAPPSVQQSKQYIHKLLLKLLHKSDCPLMLLPEKEQATETLQRALFLDERTHPLSASLQQLPFHVIHQSMIQEHKNQSLNALVDQLNVDLIVQAKRNDESAEEHVDVTHLGLPVLTV